MLQAIALQWRLRRLQRDQRQIEDAYSPSIEAARAAGDWDKHQRETSSMFFERDLVDEEIDYLVTQRLLNLAHRHMLPVPPSGDENWEKGRQTSRFVLTREGMMRLRANIREDQRHSTTIVLGWLAGLTGVVGAVSGLAAVLDKH